MNKTEKIIFHLKHKVYFKIFYNLGSIQKEFRAKTLLEWSVNDVCDWLDSLFLPEYKVGYILIN